MSEKTNKTPQGATRKIGRTLSFLFAALFCTTILTSNNAPVYADTPCSTFLSTNAIIIDDSNNITYLSNIDQNTARYDKDTVTLTLDGYNGGPICSYSDHYLTLVLNNSNILTTTIGEGISVDNGILIDGDGKLDVIIRYDRDDGKNDTFRAFESGDTVIINGGVINISAPEARGSVCIAFDADEAPVFIMNGGEISSDCSLYLERTPLIINNGIMSVGEIHAGTFFNQNGGTVNVTPKEDLVSSNNTSFFELEGFSVFNGGTFNIDCSKQSNKLCMSLPSVDGSVAEYLDYQGISYTVNDNLVTASAQYIIPNSEIPSDKWKTTYVYAPLKTYTLFNDGDINIDGIMAVFYVCDGGSQDCNEATLRNITIDQVLSTSENMAMNPATIALYNLAFFHDDKDDDELIGVFAFTDGTDGAYANIDFDAGEIISVSDNVLKNLHIYNANEPIPVPPADGGDDSAEESEENPNTLDYHLVSIISTILVSIIAEAFIIVDLKKRSKALQNQITGEK